MALIDKLEEQQARKAKIAEAFAQAAVSAITGTEIKEPEKMKAPKTELVSRLQTRNTPNAADPAPLSKLLTEHNGELPAKALWQRSGLEIDAFAARIADSAHHKQTDQQHEKREGKRPRVQGFVGFGQFQEE